MDIQQENQLAADKARLERDGATRHKIGLVAPGFVQAIHPDHGQPVTFVPGELLPRWAAEALSAGLGRFDATTGVFTLQPAPTPARGRGRAA